MLDELRGMFKKDYEQNTEKLEPLDNEQKQPEDELRQYQKI